MSDTDFWNKRREKLEADVVRSSLDLFHHMGIAGAFCLPLDANKNLFVMSGDAKSISDMAGRVWTEGPAWTTER